MKKQKNFIIWFIVLLLCTFSLVGCSQSDDTPNYADQEFIKAVSKGLQERWSIIADGGDTLSSLTKGIQAELDAVSNYSSREFEDTVLQEKALRYINVLKESLEKCHFNYSNDTDERWEWMEIYSKRTLLILDFKDNYGLTVSPKWQDTFDGILVDGKTAQADKTEHEAIQTIIDSLEFKLVSSDYGYKTYETIFDNTTDYDIETINLDINLLDADGVIIETTFAYANNIKSGQKAKLEFETNKAFEKYELTFDYDLA